MAVRTSLLHINYNSAEKNEHFSLEEKGEWKKTIILKNLPCLVGKRTERNDIHFAAVAKWHLSISFGKRKEKEGTPA